MWKINYSSNRIFDLSEEMRQKYGGSHPAFLRISATHVVQVSINEYIEKSDSFACFLLRNGLRKGDRVLTVIHNSPEWNFVEMGILKAGGIHVPLTPLYNSTQLQKILKLVRPVWIFSSSNNLLKRLRNLAQTLHLQCAYSWLTTGAAEFFQQQPHIELLDERMSQIMRDDIAAVLFTSGSIGTPKGVTLTHGNILASIRDFSGADFFEGCSRYLSILQLPMSAERKVNYSCQLNGISVCYPPAHQNMQESIALFKPQITALVPFLLNELSNKLPDSNEGFHGLRRIICGGAAVPVSLIDTCNAQSIKVIEAYGLTETASLLAYNTMRHLKPGSVGKPAASIELSFSDKGEILVRGANVMTGYLCENFTLENALDAEGWLHTGDVGELDEEGYLRITGRIKNAFKNSRGIYVYPEEIENELMQTALFEFVMILGDDADALSAIVKPKTADVSSVLETLTRINARKSAELKIIRFWMVSGENRMDFISSTFKLNRTKAAKWIKNDKFIPVC